MTLQLFDHDPVNRKTKAGDKARRIATTKSVDRRAIEAMEARGEAFTVPGFCAEWLRQLST